MAAEWYFRVMGTDFGPLSSTELVERTTFTERSIPSAVSVHGQ
jgi:hypothetical protein